MSPLDTVWYDGRVVEAQLEHFDIKEAKLIATVVWSYKGVAFCKITAANQFHVFEMV